MKLIFSNIYSDPKGNPVPKTATIRARHPRKYSSRAQKPTFPGTTGTIGKYDKAYGWTKARISPLETMSPCFAQTATMRPETAGTTSSKP